MQVYPCQQATTKSVTLYGISQYLQPSLQMHYCVFSEDQTVNLKKIIHIF